MELLDLSDADAMWWVGTCTGTLDDGASVRVLIEVNTLPKAGLHRALTELARADGRDADAVGLHTAADSGRATAHSTVGGVATIPVSTT